VADKTSSQWHALYQQSLGIVCGGCRTGGGMNHICGLQ